jgi:hypothetical protein
MEKYNCPICGRPLWTEEEKRQALVQLVCALSGPNFHIRLSDYRPIDSDELDPYSEVVHHAKMLLDHMEHGSTKTLTHVNEPKK